MTRTRRAQSRRALAALFIFFTAWVHCERASAHVKWFAAYDLHFQPQSAAAIFTEAAFVQLLMAALLIMAIVGWIDRRHAARTTIAAAPPRRRWQPVLLRASIALFFSIMALLPVSCILTPELVSPSSHTLDIRGAQWLIVIAALFKRGAIVGCIGILYLFAQAIVYYGTFHLLDYPVFVAIAVAWVLYSLPGIRAQRCAVLALRIGVALTLMWGAVEKLVYPTWGESLFEQSRFAPLTMGFGVEAFIRNAAFVEFSCAFLLLAGQLSARVSAAVLLFFLIAAIYWFGALDALGHLPIVAVLIIVMAAGDEPMRHPRWAVFAPALVPILYLATIMLLPSGYVALYATFPPTDAPLQRTAGMAAHVELPGPDHPH